MKRWPFIIILGIAGMALVFFSYGKYTHYVKERTPLRSAMIPQPYPRSGTAVLGLAFSPDGKTLAANESQAAVRLWDVATLRPLRATSEAEGSSVISVNWLPTGKIIATSDEDCLNLYDVKTLTLRKTLAEKSPSNQIFGTRAGFETRIGARVLSGDGTLAAVGETDGQLTGWDVKTGKRLFVIPSPSRSDAYSRQNLCGLCLSPDNRLLAVAILGGDYHFSVGPMEISIRDAHSGRLIRSWNWMGSNIIKVANFDGNLGNVGMAFSPDGLTLAVSGNHATTLWNVQTGRPSRQLTYAARQEYQDERKLAFVPGKHLLAAIGNGHDVCIWNTHTGELTHVFHGPAFIMALAVSPDGRLLATGGQDEKAHGILQLWDLTAG